MSTMNQMSEQRRGILALVAEIVPFKFKTPEYVRFQRRCDEKAKANEKVTIEDVQRLMKKVNP